MLPSERVATQSHCSPRELRSSPRTEILPPWSLRQRSGMTGRRSDCVGAGHDLGIWKPSRRLWQPRCERGKEQKVKKAALTEYCSISGCPHSSWTMQVEGLPSPARALWTCVWRMPDQALPTS